MPVAVTLDEDLVKALQDDYRTAPISNQDRLMLDYVAQLTRDGRAALGEADFAEAYLAGWSLDTQTAAARVDPTRRPGAALRAGPAGAG